MQLDFDHFLLTTSSSPLSFFHGYLFLFLPPSSSKRSTEVWAFRPFPCQNLQPFARFAVVVVPVDLFVVARYVSAYVSSAVVSADSTVVIVVLAQFFGVSGSG